MATRSKGFVFLVSKKRLQDLPGADSPIIKFGRSVWQRSKKIGRKPDTFSFLGFTHYCAASRQGYFMMVHKTSKENLRRKLKEVQEWLRKVRSFAPLKEWWKILKARLVGHYNYFVISGNCRFLRQFYYKVMWMAFKWINRRSQRIGYVGRDIFPIYGMESITNAKNMSQAVCTSLKRECLIEELYACKPQVRFCRGGIAIKQNLSNKLILE